MWLKALAFGDCFAERIFKSIVMMKRYIKFTGGSENVNFLYILQYFYSFLKVMSWSIKY